MHLLFDRLSQHFSITRYGYFQSASLRWPELFDESSKPEGGMVYVAAAASLPQKPSFPSDCVVVCAGACDNPAYKRGRFPFFLVEDSELSTLFNEVQRIYRRLIEWERELTEIENTDASIETMLRITAPIVQNTLFLVDMSSKSSFCMLPPNSAGMGHPDAETPAESSKEPILLPLSYMTRTLERIHTMGHDVKPRLCHDMDNRLYNLDLFYGGNLVGSVSIKNDFRPFQPSDPTLLQVLGRHIENAFQKRNTLLKMHNVSAKNILLELLQGGHPNIANLDDAFFPLLQHGSTKGGRFACIHIVQESSNSIVVNLFLEKFRQRFRPWGKCAC